MSYYIEEFSIAAANYRITSNIEIKSLLFEPQPFNLHLNYLLQEKIPKKPFFQIFILSKRGRLQVAVSKRSLKISGDISPMFKKGSNPQFGLFGNKGLIHRYILHTLEQSMGISALHACAIVHPIKNRVCIAIGTSGSGKSVFTSNALKLGWKLLATEQVLVSTKRRLFKGNQYDNVSPKAVDFIEGSLVKAKVIHEKKLVEPIGSKVFVDVSSYGTDRSLIQLTPENLTLIVANFGNAAHAKGSTVMDQDFILRVLQQVASEKICSPVIFHDQLLDTNLNGDPKQRTKVVNNLLAMAKKKIVLGGDYADFETWLRYEYQRSESRDRD